MEQKEIKNQSVKNTRKRQKNLIVNTSLLILGIAVSVSGLVIQYHYHLRKNPALSRIFAMDLAEWNTLHVWASVFFLLAAASHIWARRKWYGNILKPDFLTKHRATLALTLITFLSALSGLIPLFILYSGGNSALRLSMIEIHDKITIVFFIMIASHTVKRFKWYVGTIKSKLR